VSAGSRPRCPCGRESSDAADLRFCRFCGALVPLAAPTDPWVGKTVAGRFAIIRPLAEGGGGRVYLAQQALGTTKRFVALKMLLPEHASNPEMLQRFLRECEVVSLIEHANVVRIYDFGEAEAGVLYIAMELVPGSTLAAVIGEEGAFEPERALHAFAQICRGVAAVHDRGVVHRDLKPDNLMLVRQRDEPELVKLLDFGIAKTLAPSSAEGGGLTRMGMVIGSPPYMSPEQFLGRAVDVRTDVYALGVVAYEMFTGVVPFHADNLNDWAAQHVSAAPRPFDSTPAGARTSEPLRRAILRALAKSPAERPPSARAFLRELTEASRQVEVIASPRVASGLTACEAPLDALAPPASVRGRSAARWALVALLAAIAGSVMVLSVATSFSDVATSQPAGVAHAMTASGSASIVPPAAVAAPTEATDADAAVTVTTLVPLAVVPTLVPVPPATRPRALPKLNVSACERALQASTCEEARAAQHRCPDAAGALHERAHERANQLCAAHDHPRKEAVLPAALAAPTPPARPGGMAVLTF
jgi:hypothetical protein